MNTEPQPIISATARHDSIEVAILAGSPGPAGPAGPAGADGASVGVYQGGAAPTADREGDLWMRPVTLPDGSAGVQLHVWNGSAWLPIGEGSAGVGLPIAAADVVCDLTNVILPNIPTESLDLQTVLGLLEGSFQLYAPLGGDVGFSIVQCTGGSPGDFFGGGIVQATNGVFTALYYGAAFDSRGVRTSNGYQMPTPTGEGYLRSDTDPDTGWYFAEPVIVSETEPPAPVGGGAIWIDPTGDAPAVGSADAFTAAEPIKYADAPVETAGGTALAEIIPSIVAAVPVIVGGRRYLLPLIEE